MRCSSYSEHIKLVLDTDHRLKIIVEDSELYDLIEDILTERYGIETFNQSLDSNKVILFKDDVRFDQISSILSLLDLDEIERIYKLNN